MKAALEIADNDIVENVTLHRLCELLAIYRVNDAAGATEAAERRKALVDSELKFKQSISSRI
ncbi:MAG: hypothetical protein J1E60_00680 [Christensenellaceae bacterium]|nr:hypothetical protein [Christensenellaceae bacterium]